MYTFTSYASVALILSVLVALALTCLLYLTRDWTIDCLRRSASFCSRVVTRVMYKWDSYASLLVMLVWLALVMVRCRNVNMDDQALGVQADDMTETVEFLGYEVDAWAYWDRQHDTYVQRWSTTGGPAGDTITYETTDGGYVSYAKMVTRLYPGQELSNLGEFMVVMSGDEWYAVSQWVETLPPGVATRRFGNTSVTVSFSDAVSGGSDVIAEFTYIPTHVAQEAVAKESTDE